jgi:hypothetical protein
MNTPTIKRSALYIPSHIVGRFPLTTFFLLAYLLSWWSILWSGQIAHGPMLACLIVLALTEGRAGLERWWRHFTHWRVKWYWWLVAPGIVVGYQLAALLLNLLMGTTLTSTTQFRGWHLLIQLWPLLLVGGQWEEPGWCGYALPRLQSRFAHHAYGPLLASLILGLLRGVWHLPLFALGYIPWFDVLFLSLAMQFIASWLYNRTQGSLPVVMLFHLTSNIAGAVMPLIFTSADYGLHSALFVALACLWALVIVVAEGPALGLQAPIARSSEDSLA